MQPELRQLIEQAQFHQGTVRAVAALLPEDDAEPYMGLPEGSGASDRGHYVTSNRAFIRTIRLVLVNVALGNTAASACPLGDANSDGQIDISESLQAVNNALYGCGLAPPTATPA